MLREPLASPLPASYVFLASGLAGDFKGIYVRRSGAREFGIAIILHCQRGIILRCIGFV
jgi:hypothetical protein